MMMPLGVALGVWLFQETPSELVQVLIGCFVLLTLFLRIATQGSHTTLLTEKTAMSLLRKIQKSGLDADLPRQFVRRYAPMQHQADYLRLWDDFLEEAQRILGSDLAHARQDALALLRRECNIA